MTKMRLPDFALETYFAKWEFTAEHHLTASDAEAMTISELLDLCGADADKFLGTHLGYTPTWGTDDLREALAAEYSLQPQHMLAFAGAGEGLFWAMQLFTEPGDHVIVNVPNYQSVESIPVAAGVEVEGLPLWTGTGSELRWTLDLERFEALLRPNTKLVSVNFPNNPTGFVPDHDTWMAFNDLCHERGVRVVSDDGLPGLRVGWIASQDTDALAVLEKAKHYTSICNAGPSEVLAAMALRSGPTILERNRALVAANDQIAHEVLGRFPELFEYQTPDGGCVSFPRYLGVDGVAEFCRRAVEEAGVLLLPNAIYESGLAAVPTDRFRIGIGRTSVPASLAALEAHLTS